MEIEVIESLSGFERLQAEWSELLEQSTANSIFLTWDWARCWLRAQAERADPVIVIARCPQGRLLGIAPFGLWRYQAFTYFPISVLRPLGDAESGFEYPDWIVRKGHEPEVYAAIARHLKKASRAWDCIFIPNISGSSGACARLTDAVGAAHMTHICRSNEFSSIELPDTYAKLMAGLKKNRRQNIAADVRRFERMGARIVRCETQAQLDIYLPQLFHLNHRRWSARGISGTFMRKPREADFYRHFSSVALQRGWLWLHVLDVGGAALAAQIGYVYDGKYLALQEGFEPEAGSGAGTALRARVVGECIEAGLTEYDFLGDHTEHKARWGAAPRAGYDLLISRHWSLGALAVWFSIWPTGRFMKPTLTRASIPGHPLVTES